jgi:hypothetical protein
MVGGLTLMYTDPTGEQVTGYISQITDDFGILHRPRQIGGFSFMDENTWGWSDDCFDDGMGIGFFEFWGFMGYLNDGGGDDDNKGKPTIDNTDSKKVYYRSEEGKYGHVEPFEKHYKPIDGVAASKQRDYVCKVPAWGRVRILPDRNVDILNPNAVSISSFLGAVKSEIKGQPYEWVRQPLGKLDAGWIPLFENALIIK